MLFRSSSWTLWSSAGVSVKGPQVLPPSVEATDALKVPIDEGTFNEKIVSPLFLKPVLIRMWGHHLVDSDSEENVNIGCVHLRPTTIELPPPRTSSLKGLTRATRQGEVLTPSTTNPRTKPSGKPLCPPPTSQLMLLTRSNKCRPINHSRGRNAPQKMILTIPPVLSCATFFYP